jgi:hypothetical protein
MVERIATDLRDWTMLRKSYTMTGDGVTSAFPLPPDYRRMLTNGNVWRSPNTITPMRFFPDTDEWFQRRTANYSAPWGEWTIYGGAMHIWPIMAAAVTGPPARPAVTARFSYLDKNPVMIGSPATPAEAFTADGDTFRLPERLLKLGMIWQWKANKGSPYAEDMSTWQDAMSLAMGTDSPAPVIVGRLPISAAVRVAYPFPVPDGMVPL